LKRNTLVIRADASIKSGTGHVMRCLALAQAAVKENIRVIFVTKTSNTDILKKLSSFGIEFYMMKEMPGPLLEADELCTIATNASASWIAVDGYHFSEQYLSRLKQTSSAKILFIDDYAHLNFYDVDLLINQNISAPKYCYKTSNDAEILAGSKYVLLRDEFVTHTQDAKEIKEIPVNILVTMGGSDPYGMTSRVIEAIEDLNQALFSLRVIVGALNPDIDSIYNTSKRSKTNVSLFKNATDMPSFIRWADIIISAAGSTCWEICYFGTPAVVTSVTENQQDIAEYLHNAGCAVYAGKHEQLTRGKLTNTIYQLANDHSLRKSMSIKQQKIVDALGRQRVLAKLFDIKCADV